MTQQPPICRCVLGCTDPQCMEGGGLCYPCLLSMRIGIGGCRLPDPPPPETVAYVENTREQTRKAIDLAAEEML